MRLRRCSTSRAGGSASVPTTGWENAPTTTGWGSPLSTQDVRGSGIQVISRAAEIMRLLQAHPAGLSQTEVSDRLGLARSTVSRILLALESERWVSAVGPRGPYRLGSEISRMAATVRRSVIVEVHPFLEELSRALDETVDLSVLEGTAATFIDQVVGPQRLRAVSAVGDSFPLHCCANGKALLAAQGPDCVTEHLPATLTRFTPNTITSSRALRAEIDAVRSDGVAVDHEEHTVGICAVGAVLNHPGVPSIAVSIPVPAARFAGRQAELTRALREWVGRVDARLDSFSGRL